MLKPKDSLELAVRLGVRPPAVVCKLQRTLGRSDLQSFVKP